MYLICSKFGQKFLSPRYLSSRLLPQSISQSVFICPIAIAYSMVQIIKGCILAPHCFVDWIMEHMSVRPGINISNSNINDLVYADDTALLLPSTGDAASCLSSFSTAAAPLSLKSSWEKTKLQNLGSDPRPTNISVGSNQVDSVDSFVYLGCLQSSTGQCRPDIKRRIGFASSTMSSLSRIWKDKRLTTATKVHLNQALVMSVLLYAAETWILLAADLRTLEANQMRRLMSGRHWPVVDCRQPR